MEESDAAIIGKGPKLVMPKPVCLRLFNEFVLEEHQASTNALET
jgi:hypothetical protein